MKFNSTLLLAGGLASTATAHTWIEQLMVVSANGTMVGQPGFVRGNVLRSSPSFREPTMVNLLPPNSRPINDIQASDLMCKDTQTTQSQTGGSPRLQAPAGANVALRYQENGHVTLPQNQPGKPQNRGTVFVYGTTQPSSNDKFLSIHRVWNADGTGGDGRGVLLSTQNFDDGQCYQINGGTISTQRQKQFPHTATSLTGADMWCQQDIRIPTTAPSGQPYTLYWVWDWPTLPGTAGFPDGKQEIYTSCMDVDIISGSGASSNVAGNSFVQGQDLNFAAIANEFSNIANPTAVVAQTIAFTNAPSANGGSGGAAASTVQSQGSAATTAGSSSGGPVVPFIPVGSGSQAVGFSTNAGSQPSVAPIGATGTPQAQSSASPTQLNGGSTCTLGSGHGCHHHGGQSQSFGAAFTPAASPTASADVGGNGDTGTAAVVTPGVGPSTFTRFETAFSTVFQTKLETVFQTIQKRGEATPTVEAPLIIQTSAVARCSKTESAYRLRARSPFFIFPSREDVGVDC